jgi:hypothetical protein
MYTYIYKYSYSYLYKHICRHRRRGGGKQLQFRWLEVMFFWYQARPFSLADFFLWQITQNHVNDANTVNHKSLYSYHLRNFEWSGRENGPAREKRSRLILLFGWLYCWFFTIFVVIYFSNVFIIIYPVRSVILDSNPGIDKPI